MIIFFVFIYVRIFRQCLVRSGINVQKLRMQQMCAVAPLSERKPERPRRLPPRRTSGLWTKVNVCPTHSHTWALELSTYLPNRGSIATRLRFLLLHIDRSPNVRGTLFRDASSRAPGRLARKPISLEPLRLRSSLHASDGLAESSSTL